MLDLATTLPPMQRSHGHAAVVLDGMGKLRDLAQAGSAKAFLPRCHSLRPEVVFLNTSGGLTGGDRLEYRLTLGAGAASTATTQTAERAYASSGGSARAKVAISVGAGGFVDWLPQETILYEGSALERETSIDLGEGAGCLFAETVVLGRHAMGETPEALHFTDFRSVTRNGAPLWLDPFALTPQALALAANPLILGAARAFSTLVLVAADAARYLDPLRACLAGASVQSAASAFDGRLVLRMAAPESWALRQALARAIRVLRPHPLPRVWQSGT